MKNTERNKKTFLSKLISVPRLLCVYFHAKLIAFFVYDKKLFQTGKWFKGGKYGNFYAQGWRWIINDRKSCKKAGVNLDVPWPVSSNIRVICPENIIFHPDDLNNFQTFGIYYQAIGQITIGRGTYIAPNVGLITANHSIENLNSHEDAKPILIGECCWIGMNAVILPGVILGPHTVVGGGAVVTKSFPEGHCIVAGNPARIIRKLHLDENNDANS